MSLVVNQVILSLTSPSPWKFTPYQTLSPVQFPKSCVHIYCILFCTCKILLNILYFLLQGNDIIGLAETGSGKTGAFGLPILQGLLMEPQRYYGLILTPTRELAIQIKEQLDALGKYLHSLYN